MNIHIPNPCLVVMVGPSGSGKSTFARKHFLPTEVVSSDRCRGLITDDEADWSVNQDAFDILYLIIRKRLAAKRLTVVDATSLRETDRKQLLDIASEFDVSAVAIVLNLPAKLCHERNQSKPDRGFGEEVSLRHDGLLQESLASIHSEGFVQVIVLSRPEDIEATKIERAKLGQVLSG